MNTANFSRVLIKTLLAAFEYIISWGKKDLVVKQICNNLSFVYKIEWI